MKTLMIPADGTQLEVVVAGTGEPTVVFESGLGGPLESWRLVQPAVGAETATVAWNRPGYGASTGSGARPDLDAGARYLETVLSGAGVSGPVVIVGHSLGGLYARWFAMRHPDRVVGMVQVDPTHDRTFSGLGGIVQIAVTGFLGKHRPGMIKKRGAPAMAAAAQKGFADLGDAAVNGFLERYYDPAFVRVMIAEMKASLPQASRLRGRSLNDMPLIVLGAGIQIGSERARRRRREHLEELASLSSRGEVRWVEGSGHVVPFDRPDAVIEAVLEVVRDVRAAA